MMLFQGVDYFDCSVGPIISVFLIVRIFIDRLTFLVLADCIRQNRFAIHPHVVTWSLSVFVARVKLMICSAPFSVTVVNDSHIFLLWGKYIINCIHLAKVLQENSLGTTVDLTDKSLEGYLDEGRGGGEIWSGV